MNVLASLSWLAYFVFFFLKRFELSICFVEVCKTFLLLGMTETSPIGTVGRLKAAVLKLPKSEQRKMIEKQGRPHILTDMRIVNDDGKENPKDGKSAGTLQVRGPLIVKQYFRVSSLCNKLGKKVLMTLLLHEKKINLLIRLIFGNADNGNSFDLFLLAKVLL